MDRKIFLAWKLLIAIAEFEGYWIPGSRANRNNNPGNLKNWDPNLPKDDKGFDIFPDLNSGVRALWIQVWRNIYRNLTLRQFFQGKAGVYPGYAPLADNNPAGYATFVSKKTGIPLDNVTIARYIEA